MHGREAQRRDGPEYHRWTSLPRLVVLLAVTGLAADAAAQTTAATRLAILQAEQRRASTAGDLSTIRTGIRSGDTETARIAVRALGRLDRPSEIPTLLLALRHSLPEIRSEAANAIAQAAQGFTITSAPATTTLESVQAALIARLGVEAEPSVRAALCEAIARLPYAKASDVARAESAIVEVGAHGAAVKDRLGLARGLETLIRVHSTLKPASPDSIEALKTLVRRPFGTQSADLARDARVRRLAIDALGAAGAADASIVEEAAGDPDPQVRRLAVRAGATTSAGMAQVEKSLSDPSPIVRLEALRTLRARGSGSICDIALEAVGDVDLEVTLVATDLLGACGESQESVAYLTRAVGDLSDAFEPRGWLRSAHALMAAATAVPTQASAALDAYAGAPVWQLRMYAARAAGQLNDRRTLEALTRDVDDKVANTALAALGNATRPPPPSSKKLDWTPFTASDLRRLAAPRARVTIRDVGVFELALITAEAPAAVMRFVRLAESGCYDGVSFDGVSATGLIQSGRPEGVTLPAAATDEVGTWPHVRGAVGLRAQGTGGQFFINLVDNPQFDHDYTVFAQVLNGAEVIDQLVEGDVIDAIEIVP